MLSFYLKNFIKKQSTNLALVYGVLVALLLSTIFLKTFSSDYYLIRDLNSLVNAWLFWIAVATVSFVVAFAVELFKSRKFQREMDDAMSSWVRENKESKS